MDHYYVFRVDAQGDNIYERTCGDESRAKQIVAELKKLHPDAFYTINELPESYFY